MKKENLFSENKVKKSTIKYFVISFVAFIIVLGTCSLALFMKSIDYDISNLVDNTSTTTTNRAEENATNTTSVNELTGKSKLLFIVKNVNGVDFAFVVVTDFDSKTMAVKCFDGEENFSYQNKMLKLSSIYNMHFEQGVKNALLENYKIEIDKYIVFSEEEWKDVLSLFKGFTINVIKDITYKSHDFNLNLSKGVQDVSPDLAYKYLKISNNSTREKVICDIIKSVLVPQYVEKSQELFTSFVNLSDTDISIVDYSNSIEKLEIYCYASDKFYPNVMIAGEVNE